ncbi:hypothetical protein [Corynebacterium kroppenstedtii]|uniref:hypothetical protein n=1 Tax=Corynebacterium kroppenstedtii TaxID=161879 RepID=UPI0026898966|nr:hypothetical protein [Corynebacterium kroppenstedtii]MDU7286953.1 hypothetical protein [Corynebacterium kroppenstedtii]
MRAALRIARVASVRAMREVATSSRARATVSLVLSRSPVSLVSKDSAVGSIRS